MKYKYCLTGILLLSMKVFSQDVKPLSIGERVPSININTILNYPALHSNLAFFRNKLVILDFMATTCLGCIKKIPKLDSLRKQFGDEVEIILVSNEKKEKIKKFIDARKRTLPIVAEDTLLKKLFPFEFISHFVWIHNGVVKAITGGEHIAANNIQTVLDNKKISWPVKNDKPAYDYNRTLLSTVSQPEFYSIITKHLEEAPTKFNMTVDSSNKTVRIAMYNFPVINLYLHSYGLKFFPESLIVFEVKGTSNFIYDKNVQHWKKNNTYCYEVNLPLETALQGEKIRADLDAYFRLNGRIEKRIFLTNVIVKKRPAPASPSSNTSVASIVSLLNSRYFKTPFIDETGNGKIYLDTSINVLQDEPALKKALEQQGYDIIQAERVTEVFVLTDTSFQISKN